MRRWSFSKGHATENDFVLILDREAMLHIGPEEVRFLCNRRAGIGADGLLRAVLAKHIDSWHGDGSLWFMDYRNADGSVAEMCGNGARVFARFLADNGLVSGPVIPLATRSGLHETTLLPDGRVRVAMGPAAVTDGGVLVTVTGGEPMPALTVDVGNPHTVSFVGDLDHLALASMPRWEPENAFPDGVNLEFVRWLGPRQLKIRVYERGVGETRSCGTGAVAAAAAAHVRGADPDSLPATYRVDVPGGTVHVELTEGQAYLTGPAVLVAHGEVVLPEAASNRGE
jgi:diaminopimelate epimerase